MPGAFDFADLRQPGIPFAFHVDMESVGGAEKHSSGLAIDNVLQVNISTFFYVLTAFQKFTLSHFGPPFKMGRCSFSMSTSFLAYMTEVVNVCSGFLALRDAASLRDTSENRSALSAAQPGPPKALLERRGSQLEDDAIFAAYRGVDLQRVIPPSQG